MTSEPIVLEGCPPTPLAAYLKALGVFRLIASQMDENVRGWWESERFHLSAALSRDELVVFLAEKYEPSPIISPWNGRAGFLEGLEDDDEESTRKGAELVRKYRSTVADRFQRLRQAAETYSRVSIVTELDRARAEAKQLQERKRKTKSLTRDESERLRYLEKETRRIRGRVFNSLRSEAPDAAIDWFDACRRAGLDNTPMPLLGSGGLDGSRDFGMSFGQALDALFEIATGRPRPAAAELISSTLFDTPSCALGKGNAGQYSPGSTGENLSTRFSGEQPFNPVEIVLLLEGAMLFNGAASRRLGSASVKAASFPFTVEAMTAGNGGTAASDDSGFAEFWAPIWGRPASFPEVRALFTEGRAVLGTQGATDGLQFAAAAHRLGTDRGITEFQRYGLLQREPRNPRKATPLGRVRVKSNKRASLIADLGRVGWLDRVRSAARVQGAPASLLTLVRQLDEALFRLTGSSSAQATQDALIAIGALALEAARRSKLREGVHPPRLSSDWLEDADDGSSAFAIARAFATLDAATALNDGSTRFCMPFRRHVAPLKARQTPRGRDEWDDTTEAQALTVWTGRHAFGDFAAVLNRRLVEAERHTFVRGKVGAEQTELPLDGHRVDLAAISAFLSGELDSEIDRIAALAAGLAWIDESRRLRRGIPRAVTNAVLGRSPVGFAFAALKPLFDPKGVAVPRPSSQHRLYGPDDKRERKFINPLPLVRLIETGRVNEALAMAARTARGAGLNVPFASVVENPKSARELWSREKADRLAAALLVPLSDPAIEALANRAYPVTTRHQEELE